MVVTGPVSKLFGNLVSYPVHNQIHGLVPIELYALVKHLNASTSSQGSDSDFKHLYTPSQNSDTSINI